MQPEIEFFGLTLQSFGLMMGLGFVFGGLIAGRHLREIGKPVDWAYEMVFAALVGGLIGARLWWLAENWDTAQDDVLGSLFTGAGLTWYGGAIGGALAVGLWFRRKGWLTLQTADVVAVPLTVGYAMGRVGCQLAGDGDYGVAWDGPWAMAYPDGTVPTTVQVHPTPVYEALAMFLIAAVLWRLRHRWRPGALFALYLVLTGAERFLVEFIRRNESVVLGLTQPQLLSILLVVGGAAFLWLRRGTPARTGRAPARATA